MQVHDVRSLLRKCLTLPYRCSCTHKPAHKDCTCLCVSSGGIVSLASNNQEPIQPTVAPMPAQLSIQALLPTQPVIQAPQVQVDAMGQALPYQVPWMDAIPGAGVVMLVCPSCNLPIVPRDLYNCMACGQPMHVHDWCSISHPDNPVQRMCMSCVVALTQAQPYVSY